LERRETNGLLGGLTLRQAHARGEVSGRFSFFEQDAAVTSPGVLPGVRDPFGIPASRSHTDFRRSSFDLLSRYDLDAGASTAIGAGYQHERGSSHGELFFGPTSLPTDFSQARTTRSVFGEWRSADNLALPAQLGLRYDRSSTYGDQLTWRGTLAHPLPAPAGILVANLGTGFKPPSFFALSDPIVGNPQLRPEHSRSVDLGIYSGKAESRHIYSISVFRVRTEDLIDFDAGPPPALVNRSNVTTTGMQAFAGTKFPEGAGVSASATLLTFDLPEGTPPLRNRPRARASAEALLPLDGRGSISVTATWVGRTYDSSVPTGLQQLPSTFVLNAALRHPYGTAMFTLAIDNLLDRRFEQFVGFPDPGRRARVEVSIPL
jgi:outer membrane cobalamin receptor